MEMYQTGRNQFNMHSEEWKFLSNLLDNWTINYLLRIPLFPI